MKAALVAAALAFVASAGLVVAGVYVLAGPGWALVAGGVPFFVFGAVIMRGLVRGG